MDGFELILPFLRPIQHLILDPDISEIMVNGPDAIFIEKAGYLQRVPEAKLTPESLIVAVKNIARRLGDDISDEKPILDSRLPDGSRVAAVIPPCSIHGVTLTIRKFNSHKFKMNDLVQAGMLTAELADQLGEFVVARKNVLICGGTSSGKTTFLNSLAEFIPEDQRILLIEDTAETAARIVSLRDGLVVTRTGLHAERSEESNLLARAIQRSASRKSVDDLSVGGKVLVSRRAGSPLQILVSPVRDSHAFNLHGAQQISAIVVVIDPSQKRRPTRDILRTLFGLTPAECRVALLLGDGRAPKEIAGMIGVTVETVRSQIKSIFTKTGVNRQAELVRLL